ncbi:unnamed protein product, partial [Nesidiocoris tenuis]
MNENNELLYSYVALLLARVICSGQTKQMAVAALVSAEKPAALCLLDSIDVCTAIEASDPTGSTASRLLVLDNIPRPFPRFLTYGALIWLFRT